LTIALAGLYAFHRNEHYVVRDGAIELLDAVTGRVAPGRVWSRGLQTLVALKEGLSPPPETETVAQITFQRFFQRYWRLCGMSGTLHEARAESRAVYGAPLVRVPLHRPSQRRALTPRRFETHEAMFEAVVQRARELAESGRPVLIGTDNVADSHRLSQHLLAHRMAHQLLNALNDAEEAAIVAQAGVGGCITVATRMAGRGTDIELDERARLAGGLHVLSCQNNPSRRLDRQLAGRAGRHGDPGSVEAWSFEGFSSFSLYRFSLTSSPEAPAALPRLVPPVWMWRALSLLGQWREERRRTLLRQSLLEQDLHWEQRLAFAGAPHGVK
jgi:preprotein translocase subunit SecA